MCVVVLIAEPVECVTTHPNSSRTPLKSKRAVISNTQSKLSLFLRDIEKEKRLFYFDRTGRLRRDIKATGSSTKTRGGELGLQPRLSDTPLFSRYLWLRSCFCDISARDARGGGGVHLVRLTNSSKHKRCEQAYKTATLTAFFHLQISNMNLRPDTSIYDPAKAFYVLLMTTTKLLLY